MEREIFLTKFETRRAQEQDQRRENWKGGNRGGRYHRRRFNQEHSLGIKRGFAHKRGGFSRGDGTLTQGEPIKGRGITLQLSAGPGELFKVVVGGWEH